MSNPASRIVNGMLSKSLERADGGQDNYPEEKIQDLLSDMILRAMDGEDVLKDCPDCGFLADLMAVVVEHAKEGDDSPEVKACVSKKIPILINEGYKQDQAVAIAYSMCRKNPDVANKGKEVPEPVKRKAEGPVRYLSYADLAEFGRERLTNMTRPPVPVLKEGTSEGAKLGWETRRHGGGTPEEASKIGLGDHKGTSYEISAARKNAVGKITDAGYKTTPDRSYPIQSQGFAYHEVFVHPGTGKSVSVDHWYSPTESGKSRLSVSEGETTPLKQGEKREMIPAETFRQESSKKIQEASEKYSAVQSAVSEAAKKHGIPESRVNEEHVPGLYDKLEAAGEVLDDVEASAYRVLEAIGTPQARKLQDRGGDLMERIGGGGEPAVGGKSPVPSPKLLSQFNDWVSRVHALAAQSEPPKKDFMQELDAALTKAGTSEGAKLGWETRRGGAPAEEPKAGMPSREKWDSMQSDADAMYDANDKFRQWQSREEDAPPARRGADPGPSREFEGHLNALQDAAPKAAKVAEGLKGVPGVNEEKRSKAEEAMRGFASNGVGENDTSKYDDAVGDIWNMLDDARASHDPKYAAKTKEITTMEKEVANLANALFPKWISKGSKVAAPGEVKEIRKEFLTGLYKKRITQEDMTEGEVPIEKSVVSISRMPEAVETFAAPPANWQDGYTPIERQNLLAWVEAVDKARQTDVFRRGSMNAPFSPEFESMESRQSIGKWLSDNPDPVAYYVAQNVNLASRPSVRTMKDRVVQIAQEITTMVQKEGTSEGAKLGWETRQHGGATQGAESLREPSDRERSKDIQVISDEASSTIRRVFGRSEMPRGYNIPGTQAHERAKEVRTMFMNGMRRKMEGMKPERLYHFMQALENENERELEEEAAKRLASMGYDRRGKKASGAVPEKPTAEGAKAS